MAEEAGAQTLSLWSLAATPRATTCTSPPPPGAGTGNVQIFDPTGSLVANWTPPAPRSTSPLATAGTYLLRVTRANAADNAYHLDATWVKQRCPTPA